MFKSTPASIRLGTLSDAKNANQQLEDLKQKVKTTINRSTSEIKKYQELNKFNDQLSKSYIANLKLLIETSNLLKAYSEFFELLQAKLAEVDKQLGVPLSSQDFDSMRRLTYEQMSNLEAAFRSEIVSLKKMYSKYGKQKEFDDLDNAQRLFDQAMSSGKGSLDGGGANTSIKKSKAKRS